MTRLVNGSLARPHVRRTGRLHAIRLALVVAGTLGLWAGTAATAQALPRETRLRILEAVVQVYPLGPNGEVLGTAGSGTIISPDGYVLTNYHVVEDFSGVPMEWHAILVTDPNAPDREPELGYWARYVDGDARHDIALIKIVEFADESPVPPGTIFPFMPVGDTSLLIPGDPITVVGFPGVSGATVTFTQGIVSGFVGEDLVSSGKQWIKTDAKLEKGNSGGGAFNEDGILIGIPTLGVQEDNQGRLEEQDYLRPIDLALPLFARYDVRVERVGGVASAVATVPIPSAAPNNPLDVFRNAANAASSGAGGGRDPAVVTPAITVSPAGSTQVAGTLDGSDITLDSGEYVDLYALDVGPGATVTIDVTSNAIDPYLIVLDESGSVVLEVDDSIGAGLNVSETWQPDAGSYRVVVTSAFGGEIGAYVLTVAGATLGDAAGPSVAADADYDLTRGAVDVVGTLEAGDDELDSGEYLDFVDVFVAAGTTVRFTISSNQIDPYGAVIDPSGSILFEVDDSEGAEAFGVDESFDATVDGTYTFVVTSAFPGETGSYRLQVTGSGGATAVRPTTDGPASGVVGALRLGGSNARTLAGDPNGVTFHTYVVDVPPGTPSLTVTVRGNADIDLFAKFGSEILSYQADGDAEFVDIELSNTASITVSAPRSGPWFVDVAWFQGTGLVEYVIDAY